MEEFQASYVHEFVYILVSSCAVWVVERWDLMGRALGIGIVGGVKALLDQANCRESLQNYPLLYLRRDHNGIGNSY